MKSLYHCLFLRVEDGVVREWIHRGHPCASGYLAWTLMMAMTLGSGKFGGGDWPWRLVVGGRRGGESDEYVPVDTGLLADPGGLRLVLSGALGGIYIAL